MNKSFLIYGSYGYTGRIITEMAVAAGWKPILAGRNTEKLREMAETYSLDYHTLDIEDSQSLQEKLEGLKLVVHCAGPFSRTAKQMVEACLKTGTHYIDITGEMQVFESLKRMNDKAKSADIMIMPGAGFDVVPSDCLANYLSQQMEQATELKLALFSKGGQLSHGTATTVVENLGEGGAIRRDTKILKVPHAYLVEEIDFGFGRYSGMSIPWGDLSTAYTSTGIPNITVFNCLPKKVIQGSKRMNSFQWLFKTSLVKSFLKWQVDRRPAGPTASQREKASSYIWGEVRKGDHTKRAVLHMPEGYTLTARCALLISEKIMNDNFKIGYQTPAMAYGPDLIMEVEGVQREILND